MTVLFKDTGGGRTRTKDTEPILYRTYIRVCPKWEYIFKLTTGAAPPRITARAPDGHRTRNARLCAPYCAFRRDGERMQFGSLPREIAAGSLAAGFTATLFSPLECVKTRLQVQDLPGWPRVYTGGLLSTLSQVAREEGLVMLWSHGFVGFVGRDLLYSGLRIGLYPTVRGRLTADGADASLLVKVAAGASTGALGASIANPLDVMRVRMSCEGGLVGSDGLLATGMRAGHAPRWHSSWHCLAACYKSEGIMHGLWRGVSATVARAALLSAGQLSSYDHSKQWLLREEMMVDGGRLHVVCAVISGLVATTVCNPADVMKSAMMSAAREGGAQQASPLAIMRAIITTQGVGGFWRGWTAAYARAGPAFFIQMPIVEELRRRFGVGTL